MKPLARPGQVARNLARLPSHIRVQAYATATANAGNSQQTTLPPPWRPSNLLDDWVLREARPVSLRQLGFFGRTLTEPRLLASANYVRQELPTRLAHRLRTMQTLPYSALTNEHISYVYELYYSAFEHLRKVTEVRNLDDNDKFCQVLNFVLRQHLPVIPRLAMGVLEVKDIIGPDECDFFMSTLLRSRISRRVIAEQHLALTAAFKAPPTVKRNGTEEDDVGDIFLKCNAKEIVDRCAAITTELEQKSYGPGVVIPKVIVQGHMDATFPFVRSHVEYIVGELLRNSIQAVVEQRGPYKSGEEPPPIEVLICEAPQHVIIRVSDQGGGVDREILPYLWSFAKGPRRKQRLRNLGQVPKLLATMQELKMSTPSSAPSQLGPGLENDVASENATSKGKTGGSSLSSFTSRPPDLRLGMGLPMSKIYAEYWAGSLELHSLEGYGCDAFLQISRLGNKNEQLITRASTDSV